MLEINSTNCCAVNQLHHLHTQIDPKTGEFDPKGVLKRMFESWWKYKLQYPESKSSYKIESYCFGHYIFTGVVELKGNVSLESRGAGCKDLTYGPKLADFIKKHKLGRVVGSRPEINRVNHPNHLVKVWVWTPNVENLEKWFVKFVFPEEIETIKKEQAEYKKRLAVEAEKYQKMVNKKGGAPKSQDSLNEILAFGSGVFTISNPASSSWAVLDAPSNGIRINGAAF